MSYAQAGQLSTKGVVLSVHRDVNLDLIEALLIVGLLAALRVAVGRQDVQLGADGHVAELPMAVPLVAVEVQEGLFDALAQVLADLGLALRVLEAGPVVEALAGVLAGAKVFFAVKASLGYVFRGH